MAEKSDPDNELSISGEVSAKVYLNKLKEFSDDTFVGQPLDSDAVLHRTFQFIQQILHMDCAFFGELTESGNSGALKGIKDGHLFSEDINGKRLKLLTLLCREVNVFTEDDDGDREVISSLLDGYPATSGISVPIECDDGPRGVLVVCCRDARDLSAAKILFVKSMASVVTLFLQSQNMMPDFDIKYARQVIEAKRVWEGTVDTLNQLVIVLDEEGYIIRLNMTIEHWQLGTVNSHIKQSAEQLINDITPDGIPENLSGWKQLWDNLKLFGHIAWEADNILAGKVFRYSLRTITSNESKRKFHKGYAVLVVEDITQSKHAEEKLITYNSELEHTIRERNFQLEDLNKKLTFELEQHRKNKIALLKSEAKYIQLFNNTLAAVCLLSAGRIQFCNDRFCQVFKYRKSDLINTVLVTLFEAEDRGKILSLFADLEILDGRPTDIVILKARDGLQNPLWLELKMEHLKTFSDNTIIVNMFDITPQKNIELSLRSSEERLQKLSSQLLNAQETERKRLAMELHDGLGQSLSAIKYSMEELVRDRSFNLDGKTGEVLSKSINHIRQTIDDARCMAMDLRPSILDDLGIISTINWFCRQYEETYKDVKVEKQISVDEKDIAENRKIVIYRVMQEAMNNIAKHARADTINIILEKIDEFIGLSITDNGIGLSQTHHPGSIKGMGINSMQERVELTGGSFRIFDNVPNGTIISIRWPSDIISQC